VTTDVLNGDRHGTTRVRIAQVADVANGVVALTLESEHGQLPSWDAGAHVDVYLPSGTIRQYSLCGPTDDPHRYTVAVLRQPQGRGGSEEVHTIAKPGVQLSIGFPRNRFMLRSAENYLFLAGGIGITPILPMIGVADAAGTDWQLHYGARTADTLAFRDLLATFPEERVHLRPEGTHGRINFVDLIGSFGTGLVYACGPNGMLDAAASACVQLGRSDDLVTERFSPSQGAVEAEAGAFEVELARTGGVLTVTSDRSILEIVREAGVDVESSCEEGFCGTCETRVLAGVPHHRDEVLTDEEREANETMMICVGRAHSPRLVLDL
jgi:ferredoxin-NADP reductase